LVVEVGGAVGRRLLGVGLRLVVARVVRRVLSLHAAVAELLRGFLRAGVSKAPAASGSGVDRGQGAAAHSQKRGRYRGRTSFPRPDGSHSWISPCRSPCRMLHLPFRPKRETPLGPAVYFVHAMCP